MGILNVEIETITIGNMEHKLYLFKNPMTHEDWHMADYYALEFVKYQHNGPDYWDDRLVFCEHEWYEKIKEYFDKSW